MFECPFKNRAITRGLPKLVMRQADIVRNFNHVITRILGV